MVINIIEVQLRDGLICESYLREMVIYMHFQTKKNKLYK